MLKFVGHLCIFLLGVGLAFMVAFRSRLPSEIRPSSSAGAGEIGVESAAKPEVVVTARGDELKQGYEENEALLQARELSSERRLEILAGAVEEGTIDSLHLVRTEHLESFADYREAILPALKEAALDSLLNRFSEKDWTSWPQAAVADGGGPTEARVYVNDLMVVNSELGRYLETAALLFYGMYLSINAGKTYSAEDDLYYLLDNAEKIFSERLPAAVPARMLVDAEILRDEVFRRVLEELRAEMVLRFYSLHTDEVSKILPLIEQLEPKYSGAEVFDALREILIKLALQATAAYRLEVVETLLNSKTLSAFAAADPRIRKALAQVYLMAAVDALESGDREKSRVFLDLSTQTFPDLKAQAMVREHLAVPREESGGDLEAPGAAAAAEEPLPAPKKDLQASFEDLVAGSVNQASGGFGSVVVPLLLVVVALVVGGRIGLAFLSRRSVKGGAARERESLNDFDSDTISVTSPTEINFDDEPELSAAAH